MKSPFVKTFQRIVKSRHKIKNCDFEIIFAAKEKINFCTEKIFNAVSKW